MGEGGYLRIEENVTLPGQQHDGKEQATIHMHRSKLITQ